MKKHKLSALEAISALVFSDVSLQVAGLERSTNIGDFTRRLPAAHPFDKAHDVAVMFAWRPSSDKGTITKLSAWPIDKDADLKA